MLNGHNGDVPPWLVLPMVEEPKADLIQPIVVPSGSGEFTLGGPRIFMQALQYHWHNVTIAGTNAKAQERLVALEGKVFAFGQQMEAHEAELLV